MSEQLVRDLLAPRHFTAGLQRHFCILPEEILAVIRLIGQIHVFIEKIHRLVRLLFHIPAACQCHCCRGQCQCNIL